MQFLLDGLHEDLNKVTKRPDTSLTDKEEAVLEKLPALLAAQQEWVRAMKRDNSLITDWFTGQERSRITVRTQSRLRGTAKTDLSFVVSALQSNKYDMAEFQHAIFGYSSRSKGSRNAERMPQ